MRMKQDEESHRDYSIQKKTKQLLELNTVLIPVPN